MITHDHNQMTIAAMRALIYRATYRFLRNLTGVEYVRRVGRATRGTATKARVTSLALGRQLPYAKALMHTNEAGGAIEVESWLDHM